MKSFLCDNELSTASNSPRDRTRSGRIPLKELRELHLTHSIFLPNAHRCQHATLYPSSHCPGSTTRLPTNIRYSKEATPVCVHQLIPEEIAVSHFDNQPTFTNEDRRCISVQPKPGTVHNLIR